MGDVVGSIPAAPTIDINGLALASCERAKVSPRKSLRCGIKIQVCAVNFRQE